MVDPSDRSHEADVLVPSPSEESAATRSAFTRRSVAAPRLLGGGARAGAAPQPAQTVTPPRRARPKGVRDANGKLIQPGPYYLQASSELSEDFFLTSDVVIGVDDQVVPFVNPKNNNAVEAIVYAGGVLSHLRPNSSTTSGWVYETIDLQGVLNDVAYFAVAANTTDVYLLAIGDPDPDDNENQ